MGISKCSGCDCEIKEECFRFTRRANYMQSWLSPENPGKTCEHYIPTSSKNRQERVWFIIENDGIIEEAVKPN